VFKRTYKDYSVTINKTYMLSRYIPKEIKKEILNRQDYRCANSPDKQNLFRIGTFECPLWQSKKLKGRFNEAGYEFDHVVEHALKIDNDIDNLQALCHSCHAFKTKSFQHERADERTSSIIDYNITINKQINNESIHKTKHDTTTADQYIKNDSGEYICKICHYTTRSSSHLNEHINRIFPCSPDKIHGNYKSIHKTEGNIGSSDEDLLVHSDENEDIIFACDTCNITFTRKDNFNRHMNNSIVHRNYIKKKNTKEKFTCNICDITFPRKDNFNRHIEQSKIHKINIKKRNL
jgi:uncharacterized C2H2 Zn-finger protein